MQYPRQGAVALSAAPARDAWILYIFMHLHFCKIFMKESFRKNTKIDKISWENADARKCECSFRKDLTPLWPSACMYVTLPPTLRSLFFVPHLKGKLFLHRKYLDWR